MKQDDLFTTLDLYEETDRNMVSVSMCVWLYSSYLSCVTAKHTMYTALSNQLGQTTIRFAVQNN